jgi:hypothetical protein
VVETTVDHPFAVSGRGWCVVDNSVQVSICDLAPAPIA